MELKAADLREKDEIIVASKVEVSSPTKLRISEITKTTLTYINLDRTTAQTSVNRTSFNGFDKQYVILEKINKEPKSDNVYYIFGEGASRAYNEGLPLEMVKRIIDKIDGCVHCFDRINDHPNKLLNEFIGWEAFVEIQEDEYNKLK